MIDKTRQSYIAAIQTISPYDSQEHEDIKNTLQWIASSEYLHKPFNMEKHLGVLSVILSADRKETFLINHRKAQRWLPPGGHVNKGETFKESVENELKEELQIHHPILIQQNPFFLSQTKTSGLNNGHIDVTVWYLIEGEKTVDYPVLDQEALEGKWVLLEEIIRNPMFQYLLKPIEKIVNSSIAN